MNCCICGEEFKEDDWILRLTVYRFKNEDLYPKFTLLRRRFDDGSDERYAHYLCPVKSGAPMSLIGAHGERIDG